MKDYIIFPVTQSELNRLGIKADGKVSAVIPGGAISCGIKEWQKLDSPHPIESDKGSGLVKKLMDDRNHLHTVINVEVSRKRNLNWLQKLICQMVGISIVKKGDYNE